MSCGRTCFDDGNVATANDNGVAKDYTYDGASRLTSDDGTDFTFDIFSNRATKDSTSYTYDKNNRLLNDGTSLYTYDDNGNRLSKGNAEYDYDSFNRLTEIDGINYTYDGNGLMQTKTVNGIMTRFVWDGANIIAEIAENEVITYSRGLRLISRDDGTTKEYYHHNPHGDVTKLTNVSGATTESYEYDAFGNITSETGSGDNPFRYCGEYTVSSGAEEAVVTETETGLESAHAYANKFDYTWTYTHPSDAEEIEVTFSSDTETEKNYDFIYILDGANNQIGKYSGTALSGQTIIVPGNVVKIRLTTDGSVVKYGFKVTGVTAQTQGSSASGLIYLRARWYDPTTSTFISADPIRDGMNWYLYANGNPLKYFDPWGLAAIAIRTFTEQHKGNVGWNESTGVATFKIGNKILSTYSTGGNMHGIKITNVDGRMMAEESDLISFFNNGAKTIPSANASVAKFRDPAPVSTSKVSTKQQASEQINGIVQGVSKVLAYGGYKSLLSMTGSAGPGAPTISEYMQQATSINPNDLHHIFDKAGRGLEPLVNSFGGDKVAAYNAVYQAAQTQVTMNGLTGIFQGSTGPIVVQVGGHTIGVYGNIIDGVLNITTFFPN